MRYLINKLHRLGVPTLIFVGIVCSCLSMTSAQYIKDDLQFPYQALVLKNSAAIHSGPGDVHYETESLKQGETVEVYRHDPGGWCAIRPVSASFSLVPEKTLEIVDEGVGKVIESGTQAWVGTGLGPVEKPLWQVKLQKGEIVEVLGQLNWPNPEGHSSTWYQISPPAGEFRWVRMSDIQLPYSPRMATLPPGRASTDSGRGVQSRLELPSQPSILSRQEFEVARAKAAARFKTETRSPRPQPPVTMTEPPKVQQASFQADVQTPVANSGWRRATRPIERSLPAERSFASSPKNDVYSSSRSNSNSEYLRKQNGSVRNTPNYSPGDVPSTRVASIDLTQKNFARNLASDASRNSLGYSGRIQIGAYAQKTAAELDQMLTKEMLDKDPQNWDLESMESAVNSILETTNDRTEGAQAKRLSEKLANCAKIRSGYRATSNVGLVNAPRAKTDSSFDADLAARLDAYGWLNEMVQNGGRSESTYVLQDDSGKIIYHVAPAPGINIHRYLKSKIGVIGQRGFHTRYQLAHVTVQKVVELQKSRHDR